MRYAKPLSTRRLTETRCRWSCWWAARISRGIHMTILAASADGCSLKAACQKRNLSDQGNAKALLKRLDDYDKASAGGGGGGGKQKR